MGKIKIFYCGSDTAVVPAVVISILDMLFSAIVLIIVGYIAAMLNNGDDLDKVVERIDPERTGNLANFLQQSSSEQIMTLAIPLISNSLGFLMAIILIISALKKALTALRIWFILTLIFTIIQIVFFITQITTGRNSAVFVVPGIFEYAYRAYALWIVRCLINEIIAVKEETSEDTVVVEAES